MIIRVRTKEGTSRVSIDAKSPLFRDFKENFMKNNMKISNITIKVLFELFSYFFRLLTYFYDCLGTIMGY